MFHELICTLLDFILVENLVECDFDDNAARIYKLLINQHFIQGGFFR